MATLSKSEYEKSESKQKLHRIFNTFLMLVIAAVVAVLVIKGPQYIETEEYNSEIAQIINDEGLRLNVYRDSLGHATIGFGHLVVKGEELGRITPHEAIELLRVDYDNARSSVESRYPWASGDVKLVLINMTYQLGPSRLAKFEKALMAMQLGDYDMAAAELLDSVWATQAPNRANRIAGRILQLDNSFW